MEWEFRPQGGGAASVGLGGTLESWAPCETYNAQNWVGSGNGGVGGPVCGSAGISPRNVALLFWAIAQCLLCTSTHHLLGHKAVLQQTREAPPLLCGYKSSPSCSFCPAVPPGDWITQPLSPLTPKDCCYPLCQATEFDYLQLGPDL